MLRAPERSRLRLAATFLTLLFLVFGGSKLLSPVTPVHAATSFPLKVSANGQYLVDQANAPFLLNGDSCGSLVAQGKQADVDFYLADRQQRGVTGIIVNLIEHKFATNAPKDILGNPPFTSTNFTTPNEAYFARADY